MLGRLKSKCTLSRTFVQVNLLLASDVCYVCFSLPSHPSVCHLLSPSAHVFLGNSQALVSTSFLNTILFLSIPSIVTLLRCLRNTPSVWQIVLLIYDCGIEPFIFHVSAQLFLTVMLTDDQRRNTHVMSNKFIKPLSMQHFSTIQCLTNLWKNT